MTDAGTAMKTRLRADLRAAMKARDALRTRLLRALVADLDHAEVPEGSAGQPVRVIGDPGATTPAEIARTTLDTAGVAAVLRAAATERETAAAEMDRLGRPEEAEALRREAELARTYLDPA